MNVLNSNEILIHELIAFHIAFVMLSIAGVRRIRNKEYKAAGFCGSSHMVPVLLSRTNKLEIRMLLEKLHGMTNLLMGPGDFLLVQF